MPRSKPAARTSGQSRSASRRAAAAAVGPHTALSLEVLGQFRNVFRAARLHFSRVSHATGLSGTEVWALWELHQRPNQRVSDLAARLSVRQSSVSNLVEHLSREGLLVRRHDDPDRRVVRLALTRAGRRLLVEAPHPARGILPDALEQLSNEELLQLHEALSRLMQRLAARSPGAARIPLGEM